MVQTRSGNNTNANVNADFNRDDYHEQVYWMFTNKDETTGELKLNNGLNDLSKGVLSDQVVFQMPSRTTHCHRLMDGYWLRKVYVPKDIEVVDSESIVGYNYYVKKAYLADRYSVFEKSTWDMFPKLFFPHNKENIIQNAVYYEDLDTLKYCMENMEDRADCIKSALYAVGQIKNMEYTKYLFSQYKRDSGDHDCFIHMCKHGFTDGVKYYIENKLYLDEDTDSEKEFIEDILYGIQCYAKETMYIARDDYDDIAEVDTSCLEYLTQKVVEHFS